MIVRAVFLLGLIIVAAIAEAADPPTRIAFVDTGNTGRSVTAEALANAFIAKNQINAEVISGAVDYNPYNIRPEANFVTLLRARGIDIAAHQATQFGAPAAKFSDVILVMTRAHKAWVVSHFPEAASKVFTLGEYATGSEAEVLDAFGKPMDFYQAVLAQLDGLVAAAVTKAVAKP